MSAQLYPLLLEPRIVPLVWGGDTLVRKFGKAGDPKAALGESWECWDNNRVLNGAHAGKTLADLRAELGAALLGPLDAGRIFPILTKFIDARASLSVQVHPDDAYAQRVEGQPFGKTECWYILEAAADATLILSWKRDTDRAEYERRVGDGTLGEILRHVPVHPSDVFYLPAGTLHAIGAGIVLFETQQASDLTYRIFDWNRLGADGKPRPLHVERAADVLDFSAEPIGSVHTLAYSLDGVARTTLVADPRFVLERIELGGRPCRIGLDDRPLVVQALAEPVELRTGADVVELRRYATALVPAGLGEVAIDGGGNAAIVLTAAPAAGDSALERRYGAATINPVAQREFLEQFAHR